MRKGRLPFYEHLTCLNIYILTNRILTAASGGNACNSRWITSIKSDLERLSDLERPTGDHTEPITIPTGNPTGSIPIIPHQQEEHRNHQSQVDGGVKAAMQSENESALDQEEPESPS